jgi:integrase
VNRYLLEWNVSAPVKCPAQARATRQPWTESEVRTFLGTLVGQRLHAVMLLSLLGLRPAEVCGLRWPDVDLDAGTLSVETTRTLVMGESGVSVVEKAPKAVSGRRSLPLPTPVVAALRTFKALQGRRAAGRRSGLSALRAGAGRRAGCSPKSRLATAADLQGDGPGPGCAKYAPTTPGTPA